MFKTYKKRLEELKTAKELDMKEIVDFVIGKGMLRLPTRDEVIESFQAMEADSMKDGVKTIEYPDSDKKGWAAEKLLMDCLIISITTTPMTKELACEQLLKLWSLAHNRRKRQYLIAAVSVLVVAGGIVAVKYFMDGRNSDNDDDEVLGEMEMDEIDYDKDIPEIEIGEIPELA